MARLLLWLARAYAVLSVAALLIGLISTFGWLGATATPMGMIFAVALAYPWSALIGSVPSLGIGAGLLLLVVAISINALLLFLLAWGVARWR